MKALLVSAPRLFSRESRLRRLLRDRFVSLISTLRWWALRSHASSESQPVFSSADDAGRRYLIRSGRRAVRRFSGVVRLVSYARIWFEPACLGTPRDFRD